MWDLVTSTTIPYMALALHQSTEPTGRRPEADASLDQQTQLVHGPQATPSGAARVRNRLERLIYQDRSPVGLTVYPTAAEATIYERLPPSDRSEVPDDDSSPSVERSEWADLTGEQRAERNWERANSRAFAESRRYFVGNRLRFMWVLTFTGSGLQGPEGREACMRAVQNFVRRFRRQFGDMAYWYSPELHPNGHGWHVNFFVPKRLPYAEMIQVWSNRSTGVDEVETGHLWVSDKTKDPRVRQLGLSFAAALRLAALYACKYASKDWSPEQIPPGGRRFCAAEGFKPTKECVSVESFEEGIRAAVDRFGSPPTSVWRSWEEPDWDGPNVVVLKFAEPCGEGAP